MHLTAIKRTDPARHRLMIKLDPSSKYTLDKHSKMPNYITHGLVHKKEVAKQTRRGGDSSVVRAPDS